MQRRTNALIVTIALSVLVAGCAGDPTKDAARTIKRGDDFAKAGRDPQAAIEYRRAIQEQPRAIDAHAKLADVAARLHDGRTVAAELIAVADLEPADAPAQLRAMDAYRAAGRADAAEAMLRRAVAASPNDAAVQKAAAAYYLTAHRPYEAEPYIAAIAARAPADAFALGDFYSEQGRWREAEDEFLRIEHARPERAVEAQLRLATLEYATYRAEEADRLVSSILAADPANEHAWLLRARARLKERQPEAARQAFTSVLGIDPRSVDALAGLTAMDLKQSRAGDALVRIDRVLATMPNSVPVLTLKAHTLAQSGSREQAEKAFEQILAVEPAALDAYATLGQMYRQDGRLEEARQNYLRMAAQGSAALAANTMNGMILEEQGKPADARAAYEHVLQMDPGAAVAANNVAWLDLAAGRFDEALRLALIAKAELPHTPQVLDTAGWAYYRKGDMLNALTDLGGAVASQPDEPVFRAHLGLAFAKDGNVDRAREELARAMATGGDFPERAEAEAALHSLPASDSQAVREER